jgi:hypothetical protein
MTTPVKIGELTYGGEKLDVFKSAYVRNDSAAIFALVQDTGEPYATISENHDLDLFQDEFVVQARNITPAFCAALLACGLFEDTGRELTFGPFSTREPIWRIK